MIQFYNTRIRAVTAFNPIQTGQVKMYHCGPTLYANAHLGNLNPFIYWDVMRRMFENLGYKVLQVMNFTDIGHIVADADQGDDKMVNALQKSGQELTLENLHAHAKTIAKSYLADLADLNILLPHHLPYASQHISEDIIIIEKLLDQGVAYQTTNAIYFDTNKIENYDAFDVHGDLSPEHGRIEIVGDKRNPRDFSLWKFADRNETGTQIGWDSPWGVGFPGWHIECSAMAWRYLGESFDIHTGGIEHIAVHHTNEIAQSETAFGKPLAKHWLHNNHLQLNGDKIAKSEGNVMYLDELTADGLHPMDYRYLVLTSHYRSGQNLTLASLQASRESRVSLAHSLATVGAGIQINDKTLQSLIEKLGNDLDTPGSLALARTLLKDPASDESDRGAVKLFITEVLGITYQDLIQAELDPTSLPQSIQTMLLERSQAREVGNYKLADELRTRLEEAGYVIKDVDSGQKVYRSSNSH